MRLNNSIKQAFVRAVLDDTKFEDYTTQIHDRFNKYFYDIAPDAVKKLYDNKKTREYFRNASISLHYGNKYIGWYSSPLIPSDDYVLTDMDFLAELDYLKTKQNEQDQAKRELESKLNKVIDSFTTVKSAREALPEFAKYLPEIDGSRCKTLPAIAGLVEDLQKVGWKAPKTA